MALLLHRRDRIGRIEGRIDRLRQQATKLLELEWAMVATLDESRRSAQQPAWA